ncbi:MAG: maleylpyruvate isomerase family mycothiol-dependent enzyme [Mycobacteriales bacterium]
MDHLALLEGEVAAMAQALHAADLSAAVTSCPGWTVSQVAAHLTGVHRWVLRALDNEGPPPYDEDPQPDPVGDYERHATAMVDRLRALGPDAPAWTFDKHDQTAGFWRRRQLHEVSVHRWDVQPYRLERDVAEDGIDEVLDFFLPRQIATGRTQIPDGTLRLISPERAWVFGDGRPVQTAHGTVSDLLLGLWGRVELDLGPWAAAKLTP